MEGIENKKGYRKKKIERESMLTSVCCLNMDLGSSLDMKEL